MKKGLREWAEKYVPMFNELAQKYNTSYYTQSPLDKVEASPELMVIGFNPAGTFGGGAEVKYTTSFLKGNPCWNQRFQENGEIHKQWNAYFGTARCFLGVTGKKSEHSVDDDTKTVWTNLTPFPSPQGLTQMKNEIAYKGYDSTLDLISVFKPRRIVFMGFDGFKSFENYCRKMLGKSIEHLCIADKYKIEIGKIEDIPFIVTMHPSWARNKPNCINFTSKLTSLHDSIIKNANKSLQEIKETLTKKLSATLLE